VYRNIDNLINDNDEALDKLAIDVRDNIGYNLVDVKRRDGSIDLTPLFIGSQGTLGIVSEVILQAEPIPQQPLVGAVAFASMNDTRDALDFLGQLNPAVLEVIDARVVERAVQNGYKYDFYTEATQNDNKIEAIVVMEFDDDSGRAKKKVAKKIEKYFKESSAYVVLEQDDSKTIDIRLLENLPALV
jgi:FAD/FMN-containing dehydrogenase